MDTIVKNYPSVESLLPHRKPMLLVDEIVEFEPGKGLIAEVTADPEWPFFKGHFEDQPILPGVILVEMMFQTCGLFGRLEAQSQSGNSSIHQRPAPGRAIKVDKAVFERAVLPGEKLHIQVEFKHRLMNFSIYTARVLAGNSIAARAEVTVHLEAN